MTPSLFQPFPLPEPARANRRVSAKTALSSSGINPGTRSRPDRGSASPDSFLAPEGRKSLTLSRRKHYDFFGSMTPWQSE